jgi:hypothetical protein
MVALASAAVTLMRRRDRLARVTAKLQEHPREMVNVREDASLRTGNGLEG